MKKVLIRVGIGTLVVLISVLSLFLNVWYFKPLRIDWFYHRVFFQFAWFKPEKLSELRILELMGITTHNSRLNDYSIAARMQIYAYLKAQYAVFKRYPRENYHGADLLSYDVFEHYIRNYIDAEPWILHDFTVNQFYGIHTDLPNFMTHQHVINSPYTARQYLNRLSLFPKSFHDVIAGLKASEARGIYPPRFAIEKSVQQMEGFIQPPAAEHLLYKHFVRALNKLDPEQFLPSEREELERMALELISSSIYPAYQELIQHQREILPQVHSNDGIWRLPQGDEYYAYLVRQRTTMDISADEVHRIGLAEVGRIVSEIDPILRQFGYSQGSIGERLSLLATRKEQLYPGTDEGRLQLLEYIQKITDETTLFMSEHFHNWPKARLEVVPIPSYEEKTHSSAYYKAPSVDGTIPGRIFVNLHNMEQIPRFTLRTMAYHEGNPGHHLQTALVQENVDLPLFRRFVPFAAYSEGWAVYAERLAWELGAYKDPIENIGRLQAEMLRAVRLVVDTGLHSRHWTREQAVHYLREHTGISEDDAVIEIERYLTLPAHALSYTMGMSKILQLRENARIALGEKFNLAEFHQRALEQGEMPLALLERVIQGWIQQKILATQEK